MAKLLPITAAVRSTVELTGYDASSYFNGQTAKGKRYKFWQIDPTDEDLVEMNNTFNKLGIRAEAKRIRKEMHYSRTCLGVFVNYEHALLTQAQLDGLAAKSK